MGIIFSIALLILLSVDIYTFFGIKQILTSITKSKLILKALPFLYFSISLITLFAGGAAIYAIYALSPELEEKIYFYGTMIAVFYLPKFVFGLFCIIEDVIYLVRRNQKYWSLHRVKILGLFLAIAFMINILYARNNTTYDYQVSEVELEFKNLPESFDGIRIVQLADWHIGGFYNNHDKVAEVVNITNKLKPDMILHSGDFINYYPEELEQFRIELEKLNAPLGQYACLGNHDDGRYVHGSDTMAIRKTNEKLDSIMLTLNINMMHDEGQYVSNGNDSLYIAAIDYDKFRRNVKNRVEDNKNLIDKYDFTILLFHDPSYWDEIVLENGSPDLTLSGHTHGMQVGINLFGFRISPSYLKYEHSFGIFDEGGMYLSVSRGVGQTIIPVRIGMPPEIVVLTLKKI